MTTALMSSASASAQRTSRSWNFSFWWLKITCGSVGSGCPYGKPGNQPLDVGDCSTKVNTPSGEVS
jgi:hypothetical protein